MKEKITFLMQHRVFILYENRNICVLFSILYDLRDTYIYVLRNIIMY